MTPAAVLTVARKELRALFQSPVALLFLAVFQLVTLFTFFEASRWFARNLADVRPLFEWLPLLLVFLTAAVTMRAWAEERKLGTLEVLMTLPVRTADLVLGKFVASVGLVGIALALTLPLPIMVYTLGPLDLGPVVGGYVAALLLGALYVAIGLCISARTDNQVVSLMLTLLVGGAMYLIGSDVVTSLVSTDMAEVLRALGTGSRFESIERGVIDLRDLAYYGALTSFFLVLNWVSLELDRVDQDGARGRVRTSHLWTLTLLVGANAVALVVWLAPVGSARVDLTENGDYSIGSTTQSILAQLDEPLYIDGYFSERTHPKLAPLVPQIRDTLAEYEIAGGDKVVVRFADPNQDPDLETELAEQYSIRSVPFQVDDPNQVAVVNSFFHLLIRYGDKHEVLSFDSLIEVDANGDSFDVRLKNLEYDLTRTIKKVSQDFQSLNSVLADLPAPAEITAYVTPGTLPDDFREILPTLEKVAKGIADDSAGKVTWSQLDPSANPTLRDELFQKYGVRPLALDLFAQDTFYFDVLVKVGDQVQRVAPRAGVTESDLKAAFEAAIRRMIPGQLTTIGFYTEIPDAPPPNPQIPPQFQPPPPRPDYQFLQQLLGETYEVEAVDLAAEEPTVPDTVDVLVIGKVGTLSPKQQYAIDQYLMRGGRIVAMAAPNKIEVSQQGLTASKQPGDLATLLSSYGVTVGSGYVLDAQNATFPRPKLEKRGSMTLQRIELTPYAFFIDVRQDGLDRTHPAAAGLANVTFPWASPLTVAAPEGVTSTVLAHTTSQAWLYEGTELEPPEPGTTRKQETLAVILSGQFTSAFKGKPNPYLTGDTTAPGADASGRTIEKSLPDARLVVLGSAEMLSDLLLQLSQQPGGEVHRGNLQLLQNLIDWSTEDADLLGIRTVGAYARTLSPTDEGQRFVIRGAQYVLSLVLLAAVAGIVRARRSALTPIPLPAEVKA